MKHTEGLVATTGLVIVMAFVAARLWRDRILLGGLSWADLGDFGHDMVGLGLFLLTLAGILLALLWVVYSIWKAIRFEQGPAKADYSQTSSAPRTDYLRRRVRRGQVIAGLGVCLAVLWTIIWRCSRARASTFYVGSDLRPDFVSFGVGCAVVAVMSVAVGDMLWERLRQQKAEAVPTQPQQALPKQGGHFVRMCLISAVVGFAATVATMQGRVASPGWWITNPLRSWAYEHDLNLGPLAVFLMPMVFDALICFAILWGTSVVWGKARRKQQFPPSVG